jgi:multiple sugar transport system ATP-binding protein
VRKPAAFLMDEPLSNLDAKLRVQMRAEVSRLQQRLQTTTVYVTHDQTEAMTLGDRVAVMRSGVIQQVGAPQELYEDPMNLFVAGFIGSPSMNFMPAHLDGSEVKLPMVQAELPDAVRSRIENSSLVAGIRPEHFEDAALVGEDKRARGATFRTTVEVLESMGSELYVHFSVGAEGVESEELRELAEDSGSAEVPGVGEEGRVVARLDAASKARQGEEIELWLDTAKLHFFDPANGRSLTSRELETAQA